VASSLPFTYRAIDRFDPYSTNQVSNLDQKQREAY